MNKSQANIGGFIIVASYVAGTALWLWCLVLAYKLAGLIWLIVGLVLGGIGVVPVAIIAAFLKGAPGLAFGLTVLAGFVYALRMVGAYIVHQAEEAESNVT